MDENVSNRSLTERRQAAVARGVATATGVFAERARGAELWDVEGRRYIDFAAGIAVLNTGHLHPEVLGAAQSQLEHLSHACFQVTPYGSYVELAERLNAIAPCEAPCKTLFLSTGAEAVENAVKIARAHTGRPALIAFSGGFHGRTLMGLALTGKVSPYKTGFGPFPADVFHAPYPIPYHGVTTEMALEGLERVFATDVEPGRVAALIVEPVLGEGGFYPAPPEFLRALRALCDQHGIVFVADEIQTGFARTGRMFAIEHAGVAPDLVTLAKGIAGGFPLSAVTGRAAVMDAPAPGGLGGTYAGSPIACAAGLAVLEVIEREGLAARAEAIGERLRVRLETLAGRLSCIGEVRGLGAMVAMELVRDPGSRAPDPELTRELVQAAAGNGLILLSCGVRGNVIRLLPPLTATDAVIDEGLGLLEAALEAAARARAAGET